LFIIINHIYLELASRTAARMELIPRSGPSPAPGQKSKKAPLNIENKKVQLQVEK